MSSDLKIGYYAGSWPQNIGNAFFDFGAEAIMRRVLPQANHFRTGGAVHWMFNNSNVAKRHENKLISKIDSYRNVRFKRNGNSFEIGEYADIDILVFAGMSMSEEFVHNNGPTLQAASKNGVKILGIGTGGSAYTKKESSVFSNFIESLNGVEIITRDEDSFNVYKNKIKFINSGIDCAFFLPEYFSPPYLNCHSFRVLTFDNSRIPQDLYKTDLEIVHAHHDLWGPLKSNYVSKHRTIVSDIPEDYLTLYSNAHETFSDRVHACVATLAYGNKARLFTNSPRRALFNEFKLDNITQDLVSLPREILEEKKSHQIDLVKNSIERLLGQ